METGNNTGHECMDRYDCEGDLESIRDYESSIKKIYLAKELQDENGPFDTFNKKIFANKKEQLGEGIKGTAEDEEKAFLKEKLTLLEELENDVRKRNSLQKEVKYLEELYTDIMQSFQDRRGVDIKNVENLERYKKTLIGKVQNKNIDYKKTEVPRKKQIAKIEKKRTSRVEVLTNYKLENLFETCGKRNAKETFELITEVEKILEKEAIEGEGKLGNNIDEIVKSINGNEYFVDKKVAYLPPKGKAIFVGDTHGDSISTTNIIKQTQFVERMNAGEKDLRLVFLGDYVDRGSNDVKNLEMVLELKKNFPKNVILLRGNHEDGGGFTPYDLPDSLEEKFGENWATIHSKYTSLFEKLPNILITGNNIIGIHGGIPPKKITGLKSIIDEDSLYDIRWNDPDENIEGFSNESRKKFGKNVFNDFMSEIGANIMVRSHEYPPQGYKINFDNRLVTIFSNGGNSNESGYRGRVSPKYMVLPLDKEISQINQNFLFQVGEI